MGKISTKIKHMLLLIALITGVFLHIAYMCYLRQGFAVGGEWFVYFTASVGFGWWVIGSDD